MFLINRQKLITFGLITLLIATVGITFLLLPPKVLRFYPDKLESVSSPIGIIFSKPVPVQLISIKSSPAVSGSLKQVGLNHIVFTPDHWYQFNTEYSIEIMYFGKTIKTIQLVSPRKSSDQTVLKENAKSVQNNYPLAYNLPYETSTIRIKYIGKRKLEVGYTSISQAQAKEDVEKFVQKYGLDVSSHQYVFVPLKP